MFSVPYSRPCVLRSARAGIPRLDGPSANVRSTITVAIASNKRSGDAGCGERVFAANPASTSPAEPEILRNVVLGVGITAKWLDMTHLDSALWLAARVRGWVGIGPLYPRKQLFDGRAHSGEQWSDAAIEFDDVKAVLVDVEMLPGVRMAALMSIASRLNGLVAQPYLRPT